MAEQTTEIVASDTTQTQTEIQDQTQQTETTVASEATDASTETTEATQGAEPKVEGKEYQKLRQRAQQAERDAEYYKGLAEGRDKKPEVQAKAPVAPPKLESFENYDDFLVAKAKYEVRIENEQAESFKEHEKVVTAYKTRLNTAVMKFPDLLREEQAIVRLIQTTGNAPLARAIIESELSPEIVNHLYMNPQEANRIAALGPVASAREIGRLEAKLQTASKAEPNKISQAPEPIKAVGNRGIVSAFDYEKDINDFMKKRNAESPPGRR